MAKQADHSSWDHSAQYVLAELERLANSYEKLDEHLDNELRHILEQMGQLLFRVGQLEVRAGVWAAIGAGIPVLISLAIYLFTR